MGKEAKATTDILGVFAEGVKAYRSKDWKKAVAAFERVVEAPRTEAESALPDVRGRARAYAAIAQAHLGPQTPEPRTGEELLWDGLYHLNAGALALAAQRLEAALAAKDATDKPYAQYLMALVHARKGDPAAAAESLGAAIRAEGAYRLLAFNERDFASLREYPAIRSLLG